LSDKQVKWCGEDWRLEQEPERIIFKARWDSPEGVEKGAAVLNSRASKGFAFRNHHGFDPTGLMPLTRDTQCPLNRRPKCH